MNEQKALKYYWHWSGERHLQDSRRGKRARKRSMVICPAHRAQFFYLHPNAREYGEYFELTECEYCERERSVTRLKDYTEAELKAKVEALVRVILEYFQSKTNTVAYNKWHIVRGLIRYFSKSSFSKVQFKLVKPEKLDTLLSEWIKQNVNERNVLSLAYEKGILDTLYAREHVLNIVNDMFSEIYSPVFNQLVERQTCKKDKRSRRNEA